MLRHTQGRGSRHAKSQLRTGAPSGAIFRSADATRNRAAAMQARARIVSPSAAAQLLREDGHPIGEVFLAREAIAARVAELGAAIASDLGDREPLLVAPLKSSVVFLADLSRAVDCIHAVDTIELSPFGSGAPGGGVRLLKDLDAPIDGRDVVPRPHLGTSYRDVVGGRGDGARAAGAERAVHRGRSPSVPGPGGVRRHAARCDVSCAVRCGEVRSP